jgi:hypothetical protein
MKNARRCGLVLLTALSLTSCGNNNSEFCSGITSVADFTNRFSMGLDNFPENEYAQLRLEALDTYDVIMEAVRNSEDSSDAVRLSRTLSKFINVMDSVDWDVTRALQNPEAIETSVELGSAESLRRANAVESFVISKCGLPSTLAPNSPLETLPLPSIPGPTDTEPPSGTIDQDSEYFSTGMFFGSLYGLDLSQFEATCLGRELEGVDISETASNSDATIAQMQRAFDDCEIGFTVPRS